MVRGGKADRVHQGPGTAAIDMCATRCGAQEAGKIGRPSLLFVEVQLHLVVVRSQAPEVGCPRTRAYAIQKAPALTRGLARFDHAHDRCDADAASDEDMLLGLGMEPEQGPRRTDLDPVACAKPFVHVPGAAARIVRQAYPEAISLLFVRCIGEGILPAQPTWKMHIHV